MIHGGLKVSPIKTVSYGDLSLRYSVPTHWNAFIRNEDYTTFKNMNQFKRYLKKSCLDSYKGALTCVMIFYIHCMILILPWGLFVAMCILNDLHAN